jgi:hypothetical protein
MGHRVLAARRASSAALKLIVIAMILRRRRLVGPHLDYSDRDQGYTRNCREYRSSGYDVDPERVP